MILLECCTKGRTRHKPKLELFCLPFQAVFSAEIGYTTEQTSHKSFSGFSFSSVSRLSLSLSLSTFFWVVKVCWHGSKISKPERRQTFFLLLRFPCLSPSTLFSCHPSSPPSVQFGESRRRLRLSGPKYLRPVRLLFYLFLSRLRLTVCEVLQKE